MVVIDRFLGALATVATYYGSIAVDYDHELAQLDDQGHRPPRTANVDEPGAGL